MTLPLPAEILVSFYRSPPENQSLEQHQADEELDIKVTDKEQYIHKTFYGEGYNASQVAPQTGAVVFVA